jgi:hypothetical protein
MKSFGFYKNLFAQKRFGKRYFTKIFEKILS